MTVQDIMAIVKLRSANIAVSKNDKALIKFIYLGVSELYRLFNLSIKSETVETTEKLALYELQNKDVSLLLSVYDINGRELVQTDTVGGKLWDIKLINYRSFIVNHPKNGFLYTVYKASPIVIEDEDEIIDLPDAMIEALLLYVTYMVQSTITSSTSVLGRGSSLEATDYYQKFKVACQELEMQGYKIPLNSEMLSVVARGYK